MNKDLFLQYVEENRDCEKDRLEMAIKKGLNKAKNNRIDPKKLSALAAACIITFFMCVMANFNPFQAEVEEYYKKQNKAMPGASEVLTIFYNDITDNIVKYLGGE